MLATVSTLKGKMFSVILYILRQFCLPSCSPYPFHLPYPSHCDVTRARSCSASTVTEAPLHYAGWIRAATMQHRIWCLRAACQHQRYWLMEANGRTYVPTTADTTIPLLHEMHEGTCTFHATKHLSLFLQSQVEQTASQALTSCYRFPTLRFPWILKHWLY
jgi:hypothetical protein